MMTFDVEADALAALFLGLAKLETKGQLGEAIAGYAEMVSVYDLAMLSGDMERDMKNLPPSYRKAVKPFLYQRAFGDRKRILSMRDAGTFPEMAESIRDKAMFAGYCEMIASARDEICGQDREYAHHVVAGTILYFLTICFAMFVMDEPGHPVGMPFPGGFTVHVRDGSYYCPVREKEKEYKYAVCNFCPALQADANGTAVVASSGKGGSI